MYDIYLHILNTVHSGCARTVAAATPSRSTDKPVACRKHLLTLLLTINTIAMHQRPPRHQQRHRASGRNRFRYRTNEQTNCFTRYPNRDIISYHIILVPRMIPRTQIGIPLTGARPRTTSTLGRCHRQQWPAYTPRRPRRGK